MSKKQSLLRKKCKSLGKISDRETEALAKLKEELNKTLDQIIENQFSNYASQRIKEFNCKLK